MTVRTAFILLLGWASPMATASVEALDQHLLEQFVALVAQTPALDVAHELTHDGIVTPLSKTTTRADGVTVSVVADRLRLATEPMVRQQFAGFADRFLASALLRLPRRAVQSPEAPGLVEYRATGVDGAMFLLAWRSDQPFASTATAGDRDACSRLLPPFDAGHAPPSAPVGLQRRQVLARQFQGQTFQRSTSWQLRGAPGQLRWVVSHDACVQQATAGR